MKRFLLFSLLLLSYLPFGMTAPSVWAWPEDGQNLSLGISYLDLQKSFLDFPITWKSTMPVMSASYQFSTGRFEYGISFLYGKSTYININDSKRWGSNGFSITGFNYNFIWYNSHPRENKRFYWGLGASLENIRINQKVEIDPKIFNNYEDHYLGCGPILELYWKSSRGKLGFDVSSALPIPGASFGILRSDLGFTEKSYLWWFDLKTVFYYNYSIWANCDLLLKLNRTVLVYGRSWRSMPTTESCYSGGSILLRHFEVSMNYNF